MNVNLKLIKTKIYEKSITQIELSKRLNIGRNSFSCKLNGKRSWKVEELSKLSEILDIPIYTLLSTEKDNFRVVSNKLLESWYNFLLEDNKKEVIKSIAEVMYGNI